MAVSRTIVVATCLVLGAGIFVFAVVLHSGTPNSWALPVYLVTVAVVATLGLTLSVRAMRRRP